MKSYDTQIVWLNYIDSELKTREGRRVPLNSCVRSPTIDELVEAARRLGLDPQPQVARYPRNTARASGFVAVKKKGQKGPLVLGIAREVSRIRGEKAQAARKV